MALHPVQSEAELQSLASSLGELALPGDVICLEGELGAGKTSFTKGFARGLEVDASFQINSPSFSIMHHYPGRIPLYHFDFYRLHGADDIFDLGFEELLYGEGVSVIEWPSRFEEYLPEHSLVILFSITGECSRSLNIQCKTSRWDSRLSGLR